MPYIRPVAYRLPMKSFNRAFTSALLVFAAAVAFVFVGCATPKATASASPEPTEDSTPNTGIILREGDVIRVTFPGAKQLDTAQTIRRDGKIVLPTFGEIRAAGLTPAQLEKSILDTFGSQLVSKEVAVTIDSSTYPVFVNGAVLRPGKIEATRPITALEAIMEAGGFDYAKANLKMVKVIRTQGSEVKTFIVDLRGVRSGAPIPPFYVRPSDIIFVPERFNLF
jgi:polysaccharide export outer membrane protein